jgi:hypothetical protein
MESSRRDDQLSAALEALRPIPAPAFAAELDERAAAGFRGRESAVARQWAPLVEWLWGLTRRQILLPSLATAFLAVVIATAVVATSQPGTPLNVDTGGNTPGGARHAGNYVHAGGSTFGYFKPFEPKASSGAAAVEPSRAGGGETLAAPEASVAPAAPGAAHRAVERSAQVVLGTEPSAVADDVTQVLEAVHASHGIVLRSSVREGSEGAVGARFELLLPSARLDDALGALSEIDEVLSRRDGSADITAPTVDATERLQGSQARIDSLLNELAASETEAGRETIEAELRSERRRAAKLGALVNILRHRASFSHVSVRIETGDSASSGGSWDVGDAAGDAGHILGVAAGVALIGLALLGPIALIALLCWAGYRVWVRYSRRRVLE